MESGKANKPVSKHLNSGDKMCLWTYFVGICMTLMLVSMDTNDNSVYVKNVRDINKNESIEEKGSISYYNSSNHQPYNVTSSPRGFVIDGKLSLLLGGSIHYPRMTPSMWKPILKKARADGLNVISTYFFWNGHQPTSEGEWIDDERYNLVQFIKTAADVGLYVTLRIGPYVCAEWNNGGLPVWLLGNDDRSYIETRTNNSRWKSVMKKVVKKVTKWVEPHWAHNGGNIILAQIENEYNREGQEDYVQWCGELVNELNVKVPWIMCNGKSAKNTIETCNDNDCNEFATKHTIESPNQPLMWTENEGWFQEWVLQKPYLHNSDRLATEISYAVARFFAVGGSFHNYYMWYGGNHYGRTAAAGVTHMYANGVNLHSDGMDNEPKKSHLKRLHETLALVHPKLVENPRQILNPETVQWWNNGTFSNATKQRAYCYSNDLIFLENSNSIAAIVRHHDQAETYFVAAKSMLIIYQQKVVYNTSDISDIVVPKRVYDSNITLTNSNMKWESWSEDLTSSSILRKRIVNQSLVEQLRITQDKTDYLLYTTSLPKMSEESQSYSYPETNISISTCESTSLLIFLDNTFIKEVKTAMHVGNCTKNLVTSVSSKMLSKANSLSILSISLGLGNLNGLHAKGIFDVIIHSKTKATSLRNNGWTMTPGSIGEWLSLYNEKYHPSVNWKAVPSKQDYAPPMTWYKTDFVLHSGVLPTGLERSILLDANGLNRGRFYLNGRDVGRYWLIKQRQRYYHLPFEWIKPYPEKNSLVLLEELGTSPTGQSINMEKVAILSSYMTSTKTSAIE